MNYVYLNGKFVEEEKACISVFDRGFLYGDGIFETMRAYDGYIFAVDKHLDRLFKSIQYISINIPLVKEDIKKVLYKTLEKNELKDAYIRLTVSRGVGGFGLDPKKCDQPTIVVFIKPVQTYPDEWYKNGIVVAAIAGLSSSIAQIKSCNFLNNVLAKIEATNFGVHDAVFVNSEGHITEAATSNIFIVKDGALVTPSLSSGLLPGVTREMVVSLAKKNDIIVKEKNLYEDDVAVADECFLTNTGYEIMPVRELKEKKEWQDCPGPVTSLLMKRFRDILVEMK